MGRCFYPDAKEEKHILVFMLVLRYNNPIKHQQKGNIHNESQTDSPY